MSRAICAFFLAAFTVLFVQCSDDGGGPTPPPPPCTICDTCGNYNPISSYDSTWGVPPNPNYALQRLRVSKASGWWAGNVLNQYSSGDYTYVFLYNPQSGESRTLSGESGDFSNDGTKLLIDRDLAGCGIYDINTDTYTQITPQGPYHAPSWSIGEDSVFVYDAGYQVYVVNLKTKELTLLPNTIIPSNKQIRQVDERTLIWIRKNGIVAYDLQSTNYSIWEWSALPSDLDLIRQLGRWDISPDKKKILVDLNAPTFMPPVSLERWERMGVYLYDIEAKTIRQVIKGQNWSVWNLYYPTWASNTTWYGTFFCRKDSTAMIYEYDLTGKVLRQVTNNWMKF